MAHIAVEGDVYRISHRGDKPEHVWIALCSPNYSALIVLVSFTDQRNYPINPDVWKPGTRISPDFVIQKDSVLQLAQVFVRSQKWLDERDAQYLGPAPHSVLFRARCNLALNMDMLRPEVVRATLDFPSGWDALC